MGKLSVRFIVILIVLLASVPLISCKGLTPSQAVEYYNKGVALSNESRYDEAIAEYNKAIEIDPNYINAYVNRGYAYLMKKQYELAIADYTKAIGLDPNNKIAYNGRGAAYIYTKQFNLALLDYNKFINLDPNQDQINRNIDYCNKMLTSKILTGEWVNNASHELLSGGNQLYGLEMFDGMGSYWFYDVVLSVVEDSSGNFKGTWTQTLLKVLGPAASLEGAEKYWTIGVPDKYSITGRRSGEAVQLDFGGRVVPLEFVADTFLDGKKKYYDYGSPVGSTPKFYEEQHPELGSSYIVWTYTIALRRK